MNNTADRLAELAKADKEGRCEVLPCKAEPLTPCDLCKYNPPSSFDGKPCGMCPAQIKQRSEQDD